MNTFTGNTGNDSFDASLVSGAQTWQSSDALVGAAGTDTLTATLIANVTPVTMTGIEVVNVTVNTTAIVNLTNATGVTNVNSVNSLTGQTVTFSGITTAVTPSISDTDAAHVLTYTGVSGSSDAETVNVTGMTGTLRVDAIELLTLNAVTSASTIPTLTASTATTLTATGDQALTITAVLPATINNVTASTKTAGGLTVAMGAVAAATLVGGAGADSFTFTGVTGNVNASGGAGNDTFTSTTTLAITDTITGGDGVDTISAQFATVSTAGYVTPTTRTITGIETLTVTDDVAGALTAVGIDTGITTVNMTRDGANTAAAVTFNPGASTLNIGSSATTLGVLAASLAVVGATTDGDNITVKNNNVSTSNAFAAINIAATGTETLTINSGSYTTAVAQTSGTVGVTGSVGFQSAETLAVTGANRYTPGVVTADIINASAMTFASLVNEPTYDGTAGTTATTLTGSAGNDILVASTTSNVSIAGGAGNDAITGGIGNDILNGEAGNDTITAGAGNDNISTGEGTNSVLMATNLNAADTVTGGSGTDTLSLGAAATAATAVGVTLFETLTLTTALTQTMAAFPSTNAFTRVNVDAGTSSITNAGAAVVTLGSAVATTQIDFALATGSGTTDALTFRPGNTLTQAAVNLNDIETLTITNDATTTGNGVATITALSATSMKTLNIAGLAGTVVTNAITGTVLTAVNDNHTGAGAVTLNISNATAAVTYTGGAGTGATTLTMGAGANIVTAGTATTVGNFTVTGGAGAESMTGGYGADSFSGGAGNDTLIGGEGADTLQGGAGNDSLSGGAGVDQFESESGADTYDGGGGTDVLTITAGFTNISTDTITSIETLEMAGIATTMTIAQANLFTTFNTQAALTFVDAGTVAANATVLAYTLANGTNTITANAADLVNTFTGGTGADTFNFGLDSTGAVQRYTAADVVNGTSGFDTINYTGNIAFNVAATNVSNIDSIVFANSSTAVIWTAADGNVVAGFNLTLDGSAGTTGTATMTFDASAETTGTTSTYNMIGGTLSDTLTGGSSNDTIFGAGGADVIIGGVGADDLSGGEGNDQFTVATAAHLATGEIYSGGNGTDTLALTATNATVNLTLLAASSDNLVGEASIEQLVVTNTTLTLNQALSGTALAFGTAGAVSLAMTVAVDGVFNGSTFTTSAFTYGPTNGSTATVMAVDNDTLVATGGANADTITAIPFVVNTLIGNAGNDTLTGKATATDVFQFGTSAAAAPTPSGTNVTTSVGSDTITTYVVADDSFTLDESLFGVMGNGASVGAGVVGLLTAQFAVVATMASATTGNISGAGGALDITGNGAIIYVSGTGGIYFVAADATLAAGGLAAMTASEIALIGTITTLTGTMVAAEFNIIQ